VIWPINHNNSPFFRDEIQQNTERLLIKEEKTLILMFWSRDHLFEERANVPKQLSNQPRSADSDCRPNAPDRRPSYPVIWSINHNNSPFAETRFNKRPDSSDQQSFVSEMQIPFIDCI
jgi:hypothetical protein